MKPHTSYFICAAPRSGSFLLCEALRNTGLAGQPNEYFGLGQEQFFWEKWQISNYADYIAKVIEVSTSPNGVFGTKILSLYFDSFIDKLKQMPEYKDQAIPDLLSTIFPNLHYIWLRRRDKVRQAVSYWKAVQTGIWTATMSELPLTAKELMFDFEAIDRLVHELLEAEAIWQQYFNMCGISPFIVVYEELTSNYEATALQILRYLDSPIPEKLVFGERYLKQQADALSDEWVQQYHKLKQTVEKD